MLNSIDSLTNSIANKSLDALWMRSNAITDNIANVDTPGYKQKTVNFENELSSALSDNRINESELNGITPETVEESGSVDQNGNGVDLESQMIELARNQYQYSYMSKALTNNYALISLATNQGKG